MEHPGDICPGDITAGGADLVAWATGRNWSHEAMGFPWRLHGLSMIPGALSPRGRMGKKEGAKEGDSLEGVALHALGPSPTFTMLFPISRGLGCLILLLILDKMGAQPLPKLCAQ